jgi:hypothetical protein
MIMSVCTFIAADTPLQEVAPSKEYPVHIDIDKGIIDDGGADDNFFLFAFRDVQDYTDKKYGVYLEWNYTDGRAEQILKYIRAALEKTELVELGHVWLMDYYEFEDRPYVHRRTVSAAELTAGHIREIDGAEIWNKPDKMYPERPSFYCLTITA